MKNSKFKCTSKEQTLETEGPASTIIAAAIFLALATLAFGVTYVLTRDTKATLEVFESVRKPLHT